MTEGPLPFLQGTLDMLVLKALRTGPRHGYDVMRWIRDTSGEELALEEGALYPALHRMEGKGWIEAEWGLSENNRRAKYYRLTPRGSRELEEQEAAWLRYVAAVQRILQTA